ncbi:SMP-30/gluconolactonase/LRE family protein [Hymenobacter psychrophilus]|uniref:SMP-30/Gluconolaconase/LRE-like region-containing protein n=1 Tax=Hymenobacter psychrophilus TaxID=651662 RepID=A0A1H3KIH0_9BACT|nr:SMP-30/gluconolactonase/LRE family protein [Hymenobacter psychrophilus]SDY51418.1 SMP-30/Gluconolaconase/LRE-like region-containing protein [Hymenobacter psychrophilus]
MAHLLPINPARRLTLPRFLRLAILAIGLATVLPGCSDDDDMVTAPASPEFLTVRQAALHPEGIQWDEANKRFIVSSRTQGRIGTVKDDSTYTQLADDARLVSTIGLHLDASRNRLLAAVSDAGGNATRTSAATLRKLAALAIFNASTGSLTSYIDLGALRPGVNHFANDIAVDAQGNAYITDSFAPIIYKVDLQGTASVFLEDPQLSGGTGFGLNGLVFHPDGYLIVAKANDGTLFKVPLATPKTFTRVTTTQSLVGADGLLLLNPQTLLLVSGSQTTVFRLTSTDGWASTTASGSFATGPVSPTTITRRSDADAYVLYPYQATSPRFAITKAKF